jgi:hypothetical protein
MDSLPNAADMARYAYPARFGYNCRTEKRMDNMEHVEHTASNKIHTPPGKRKHRHKIFIIDHPYCDVYFELDVENRIFETDNEVFVNPALWQDGEDISQLFNDTINRLVSSGQFIVPLQYQPDMLRAMRQVADEVRKQLGDVWVFLSFFHDDKSTTFMRLPIAHPDPAEVRKELEQKAEWILNLGEFPFIKMVEVKPGFMINSKEIQRLFTEYSE